MDRPGASLVATPPMDTAPNDVVVAAVVRQERKEAWGFAAMSELLDRYQAVEKRLVALMQEAKGASTLAEDEILDELDALWVQMTEQERKQA